MLCAGFEESHLMMWSLTPQPLPCRRDSERVSNIADATASDGDQTHQPRFLLDLPFSLFTQYRDSADNAINENAGIFSLISDDVSNKTLR